ncbi:MAG TPA: glycosyltransferase family 2 protein [Bacillota bacterium]|nr:glycosyltransferase family 2 protein [Bacillota bacterium]
MLSIVIPTYNEGENVVTVTNRIEKVLANRPFEVLFVDDSTDNTPVLLHQLALAKPWVRVIHREGVRGLATAVTLGFQEARGNLITVMDGDLQHPPELLPELWNKLEEGYDLVVPSRFIPGGSAGGLSWGRTIISKGARLLASLTLRRTRNTTDPMSGFFMFRKNVISGRDLNPLGWKILLEILVKGNYELIGEVPYQFQPRLAAQSKMSLHEQCMYLWHLSRLVASSPEDSRFWRFCLVGLSGVVVNLLTYIGLIEYFQLQVVLSGILAALVAMFSNFLLNDTFTWGEIKTQPVVYRLVRFYIYCSVGISINAFTLWLLFHRFGFNYLLANILGICLATVWNFSSNNRWTWNQSAEQVVEADDPGGKAPG